LQKKKEEEEGREKKNVYSASCLEPVFLTGGRHRGDLQRAR
jgi:hypothetical protein